MQRDENNAMSEVLRMRVEEYKWRERSKKVVDWLCERGYS